MHAITQTSYFPKDDETWGLGVDYEERPDLFDAFELLVWWDHIEDCDDYGGMIVGLRYEIRKNGRLTNEDPYGVGARRHAELMIFDRGEATS